ncbi:MAG: hopanoid biosynthesis-associated protein HpnK [Hyphomicrobium sp.]
MRNLIINADDFGNALSINEAVEEGYNAGIISSASLMVSGDAYEDAVRRILKIKHIGVGLHLTLLDGIPVLPPDLLPNLVSKNGKFFNNPISLGIKLFFSKRMQKQAEIEIEAQFKKFMEIGIEIDHVNSHMHFHMHPNIIKILGKLLPKYGDPPVRVPYETFVKRSDLGLLNTITRRLISFFLKFQNRPLKKVIHKLGILSNNSIFGLFDTGNMDEAKFIHFLHHLPNGITEIYFHPASNALNGHEKLPKNYQVLKERQAITSPKVKETLLLKKISPTTYSKLKYTFLKS